MRTIDIQKTTFIIINRNSNGLSGLQTRIYDVRLTMNCRPINASTIIPRMPRPPPQQSHRPIRASAVRPSRDPCHDVTARPITVSGRSYNNSARVLHQTNRLADLDRTQQEVNAHRTVTVDRDKPTCQRQSFCQARWQPRLKADARPPLPGVNNRQLFPQRVGKRNELPLNVERQRTDSDQIVIGREISRSIARPPGERSYNCRDATKPEPEVETDTSLDDGSSPAAAVNDGAVDDVAVVDADCSRSLSSQDSVRMSVTWYNGDDVTTQVRELSARSSGVFSRMSTEAQRAWIAVRHSAASADSSGGVEQLQETDRSPPPKDSSTSGLVGRETTMDDARGTRRRRAKRTTKETPYNVFEAGYNRVQGGTPFSSTSTYRVVAVPHRAGEADRRDSRAFGNFRITSAAYDSRFVDMALAAAESRRGARNCVTGDDDNEEDYSCCYDDDGDDTEIRAASVAKCLLWLRRQRCQ